MEGDVLGDARSKHPSAQFQQKPWTILEMGIDEVIILASFLAEVLLRLMWNVNIFLSSGLLLFPYDTREAVELANFPPSEGLNIAFAYAGEACEKERVFEIHVLAWGSVEHADLLPGEVLTAGLVLSEAFYSSERVHGNDALIEGMVDACLELVEIGML